MHLLVVGLSPRDEATFGFFLGRFKKGWTWQGVPADHAGWPQADITMVELAALGMPHWSPEAQTALLQKVGHHPAVLVVPANDRTWTVLETEAKAHKYPLILLPRPYGTDTMRAALEQAAAWVSLQAKMSPPPQATPAPTPAPTPSPMPAPAVVAPMLSAPAVAAALPPIGLKAGGSFLSTTSFLATGAFRPLVSTGGAKPAVQAPAVTHQRVTETGAVASGDEPTLTLAQLVMRLGREADQNRYVFLRQLAQFVTLGKPFEARFTVQNSLIIHPGEGWAASNTPMMVIERVCKSDAMASAIGIRDIEPAQAAERVHRLNMPLRELEALLWELAAAAELPT